MNPKPHRLTMAVLFLLILTIVVGLSIVPIETVFSTSPNITTYENGLWWSVTTITSVGYGDYYPTSTVGKLIGSILEVAGVTTFGVIVALVTIDMYRKEQQFYWNRTTERFNRLEEKLDRIEKQQSFTLKK